ncbi:MAG: hypothetical protein ABSE16_08760 [Verrucomicrobiota bacterium]|jgi:hypothetical protein
MKHFLTIITALAAVVSCTAVAASYSTEATITPLPDKGQYQVDVRVSRLVQQDDKVAEEVIARPRIFAGLGCPASFYQGSQPANPDYLNENNVSVDVSWPYPKESGVAFCTVVVKQGDEVVSRSKFQLQVMGPGRVPLILSPQNVDAKSVRVMVDKSKSIAYVLLEFGGKTDEDARAMAIENLGNKVQIQDAGGHIVGSGHIEGGAYNGIGVALPYSSENEAQRVATILGGAPAR